MDETHFKCGWAKMPVKDTKRKGGGGGSNPVKWPRPEPRAVDSPPWRGASGGKDGADPGQFLYRWQDSQEAPCPKSSTSRKWEVRGFARSERRGWAGGGQLDEKTDRGEGVSRVREARQHQRPESRWKLEPVATGVQGRGPHILLTGCPAPRTCLAHTGRSIDTSSGTTFQRGTGSQHSFGVTCGWSSS